MRTPHLLRVKEGPESFATLLAALEEAGRRCGWLELDSEAAASESLERAAALPVLRAVAVGAARTVTVKPRRGQPVLRDLLREHFRGCDLVLVRGEIPGPELCAAGDGWRIETPQGGRLRRSTAELVRALGRPRPW